MIIHPFEDGNGRIARAISDLCLARADNQAQRFYSLSASIERHRKQYYAVLEKCQKGPLDITPWLQWFLNCLAEAITHSDQLLKKVLQKTMIWDMLHQHVVNVRHQKVVNLLLGDFHGKLTTSKYAKIAKCSQDTALRDIQLLVNYGVMKKNDASGNDRHDQWI